MNGIEAFDRAVFLWINSRAGGFWDYLFGWPTHLISFPIFGVLFVFQHIWEEKENFWRRWAGVSLGALAGTGAAHLLRLVFDRARPLAAFPGEAVNGRPIESLFGVYLSDSFPSAHAACAFGAAAALAYYHPKRAWIFYSLALWLSFTRIYVGAHFPTDVLAGAAIGIAAGFAAVWMLNRTPFRTGALVSDASPRDGVRLSVVVPAHNEEENVVPLWQDLKRVMDELKKSYEVIFVDDGSTDRTFERLVEAHDRSLVIVRLDARAGLSSALQAGFDAARGEIVVTLDADRQVSPEEIPGAIARLEEGFDAVFGRRLSRRDPFVKRLGSRVANAAQRAFFGAASRDAGCGLRVFRRSALERLRFRSGLHRFAATMAVKAGLRIGECDVAHAPRRSGRSKFGSWDRLTQGIGDAAFLARTPASEFKSIAPEYQVRETIRR